MPRLINKSIKARFLRYIALLSLLFLVKVRSKAKYSSLKSMLHYLKPLMSGVHNNTESFFGIVTSSRANVISENEGIFFRKKSQYD